MGTSPLFTPFRLKHLDACQPLRDAGDAARHVRGRQAERRARPILPPPGRRRRAADHRRERGDRPSDRDPATRLGLDQPREPRRVEALRRRGRRGGRAHADPAVARRRGAQGRRLVDQPFGPGPAGPGERPRGHAGRDRRAGRSLHKIGAGRAGRAAPPGSRSTPRTAISSTSSCGPGSTTATTAMAAPTSPIARASRPRSSPRSAPPAGRTS